MSNAALIKRFACAGYEVRVLHQDGKVAFEITRPTIKQTSSLALDELQLLHDLPGQALRFGSNAFVSKKETRWKTTNDERCASDQVHEGSTAIGYNPTNESSEDRWWTDFLNENTHRSDIILKLIDELRGRGATLKEFFIAYVYSGTNNIQANLHFLDYSRLTNSTHPLQGLNNCAGLSPYGSYKLAEEDRRAIFQTLRTEIDFESALQGPQEWWAEIEEASAEQPSHLSVVGALLRERELDLDRLYLFSALSRSDDLLAVLHYFDFSQCRDREFEQNRANGTWALPMHLHERFWQRRGDFFEWMTLLKAMTEADQQQAQDFLITAQEQVWLSTQDSKQTPITTPEDLHQDLRDELRLWQEVFSVIPSNYHPSTLRLAADSVIARQHALGLSGFDAQELVKELVKGTLHLATEAEAISAVRGAIAKLAIAHGDKPSFSNMLSCISSYAARSPETMNS